MSVNEKSNWYVITGSSCSGKTTLVKLLEDKGYDVVYEVARDYIDEEMKKGRTIEEIRRDELGFQRKILELKVELEQKLDKKKMIFFDRGVPDSAAYYEMYGAGEDKDLKKAITHCRYKKVFLLEPLGYSLDYARTESEEEQLKLQDSLGKSYEDLGFPVVKVPKASKRKRLDYILDTL